MDTLTEKQIRYTHDLLGANPDDYATGSGDQQNQSIDPGATQSAGSGDQQNQSIDPGAVQSSGSDDQQNQSIDPGATQNTGAGDQQNQSIDPGAVQSAGSGDQQNQSIDPGTTQSAGSGDQQNQSVDPGATQSVQPAGAGAADIDKPNQSLAPDADAAVAKQPDQTDGDQSGPAVIMAGASIPPMGGPDPCLDILEQIIALLDELAKRINDALDDPHDLYNKFRKVKDAHPQYGSWDGHEDRFKYDRNRLRQKIGEWEANDNCRGRRLNKQQQDELNEAYEYKEKEYPEKPSKSMSQRTEPEPAVQPDSSTADKVLKVLLVLGLAIALVPTVIAALADPEPASKLALAGLTFVEITALAAALGFSAPKPPDGA